MQNEIRRHAELRNRYKIDKEGSARCLGHGSGLQKGFKTSYSLMGETGTGQKVVPRTRAVFDSLNLVVFGLFLDLCKATPHGLLGLGRGDLSTDQSANLYEWAEKHTISLAKAWLRTVGPLTTAIKPPKRKVQATPLVWA
jgi:hypothetical protein